MTRSIIIKDYFSKNMKGEYTTVESLVKRLSKTQLIQIAKNDCIFYRSSWNKQEIFDRVFQSIAHVVYGIECCNVKNDYESIQEFCSRIYTKYFNN